MTLRILIVEDKQLSAKKLETDFKELGFDISAILDTRDSALAFFENNSCDVVWIDATFGGDFNGVLIAHELKKKFDIPLICTVNQKDKEALEKLNQNRSITYLTKPLEIKSLETSIELEYQKQELESKQKKLNLLNSSLNSIEDGIIITGIPKSKNVLKVLYANLASEELLGLSREEIQNKNISELLEESDTNKIKSFLNERDSKPNQFQFNLNLKNHPRPLSWTITIIENNPSPGDPILIHKIQDLSHIRKLEENLNQSQKLEAMGQLASGIAHDFNNIIAIITGLSELLILKTKNQEKLNESAQKIYDVAQRGNKIISELMLFSRKDNSNRKNTDLSTSLESIINLLKHLLPSTIDIRNNVDISETYIPLNKTKLEQLIFNLATNARDAIPDEKGSIMIKAKIVELSEQNISQLKIPIEAGSYACISISDTGTGMTPKTIENIFEPFFTTKELGKGTGLGLSTVFEICRNAEGSIAVESEPNKGSTFKIYLPFSTTPDYSDLFIESEN